jgi:hypothetical protein
MKKRIVVLLMLAIVYHLTDADNSRMYRVTLIIMPSYINNFISIERLI